MQEVIASGYNTSLITMMHTKGHSNKSDLATIISNWTPDAGTEDAHIWWSTDAEHT